MGIFFQQVARALAGAGFRQAADELVTHGALFSRAKLAKSERGQLVVRGSSFDLASHAGLAALANTIMEIKNAPPAVHAATTSGVSTRVTNPRKEAEKARKRELISEVAAAGEAQIAHLRKHPWLAFTGPYRLWQQRIADQRFMLETVRARPNASAEGLAAQLLHAAGFDDSYSAGMTRLRQLQRLDAIPELWSILSSRPTPQASERAALLASVGACPSPDRTEALRRKLPALVGRLLITELEQRDADAVLQSVWGTRRLRRDLQLLEQVHVTVREELDTHAAIMIDSLLTRWNAPPVAPQPEPPGREHDWRQLLGAAGPDPLVPDEVMRSLLEAALRHGRDKQVYGLPTVEHWVEIPDRLLSRMGIQRLRFVQQDPEQVQVVTAPAPLTFPLAPPPLTVHGSALYIAMMAALTYAEMVTRRDGLLSRQSGSKSRLQAPARGGTNSGASQQAIRVGRSVPHNGTGHGPQSDRSASAPRPLSYVIPHLRLLLSGEASAGALANAAEHGIRIPDRYTFVRGHVRGDGAATATVAYSIVDVALETVRRFQAKGASR